MAPPTSRFSGAETECTVGLRALAGFFPRVHVSSLIKGCPPWSDRVSTFSLMKVRERRCRRITEQKGGERERNNTRKKHTLGYLLFDSTDVLLFFC